MRDLGMRLAHPRSLLLFARAADIRKAHGIGNGARIVGIDPAAKMVDAATGSAARDRAANVECVISDATRLPPFEGGAFDAAFARRL
jgi:ubiquinone/menaquinone biosynthesis C-methylase UbiE